MDIEQVDSDIDVESLADRELVMLHAALHSYWVEFQNGREIEGWSKNDVIDVHGEVRAQLKERGLPHQELNGLDDVLKQQSTSRSMAVELEPARSPRDAILSKLKDNETVAQSELYELAHSRSEIREALETLDDGEIIESPDVTPKCWYLAQNKHPRDGDVPDPTQEDIEALAERITADDDARVSRSEMR